MDADCPVIDPEALDAVGRYIASLEGERGLSAYTLRNYGTDLRHYLTWLAAESISLTGVTRTRFRTYIAAMQEAGTAHGSVTRRVSTVKSFYKWLRLRGEMRDDPLALVVLPKKPRRLPHVMDLPSVTDLIAAADETTPGGLRDRAILELLYGSGLRVSEAASLDAEAVDLDERTVLVRGKGNKQRLVMMGEPARSAVVRYLREGRGLLLAGGRRDAASATRGASDEAQDAVAPTPALFINRHGERLSQRRIQIVIKKYALKAGIDARVHPHLLRHTFATHLLDGGAELRVVQELLGHSNPNTTQVYLHVTEERQRSVMEGSLDGVAAVEEARRSLARERRP